MEGKIRLAVFGQKRLSREGGIEIVVKELCTRMAQNGCEVTCYNRAGHHVSGAEYDKTIEYDGIRQKVVPTIEKKGLAAVSSSFFAALCSAFGRYDVVHIHAEGPAFFCWMDRLVDDYVGDKIPLWEKIMDRQGTVCCAWEKTAFEEGLKVGIRLMMEAYSL